MHGSLSSATAIASSRPCPGIRTRDLFPGRRAHWPSNGGWSARLRGKSQHRGSGPEKNARKFGRLHNLRAFCLNAIAQPILFLPEQIQRIHDIDKDQNNRQNNRNFHDVYEVAFH
jgi:hypothetical protein